ncbi:tRNA dimethylallyltransferase [Candidatus Saccharibacteria bacterium]|nr:tRNA dimethylallyltransferase [Candidatus Saccharibacteria bacterium]
MKQQLLVIVGPTASGKTSVAIEIAQQFNGEIICADSRTVYKDMDIGTAKPTKEEQEKVPHHLLDVVLPDQPFTVADFKRLADEAIKDINKRDKLPIIVGGSGLYIDSILYDYKFSPKGSARDPINPRHLDKTVEQKKSELRPDALVVGIDPPLEVIKQRVINRVDEMVNQGFIDEVNSLLEIYSSNTNSLNAPGYKAFKEYVENKISLSEAKERFVRNDYLLARRQRTWFKRNKSIHWFNNRDEIVDFITTQLNKNRLA